ncbi:MAG: DUF4278 domain-containing protein [Cytophagales bacterium]|nr:MAG: DUF4278 domain-containing protein [Cytophagales bacterium]
MERSIKYLYYRGVRYASSLIVKKVNLVQELTYRGAKLIKNSTKSVLTSSAQKMYRGVAY